MIYWIAELASEHPVAAIITAIVAGLGSLLAGIAAVIDARTARNESVMLRAKFHELDKRVTVLERK